MTSGQFRVSLTEAKVEMLIVRLINSKVYEQKIFVGVNSREMDALLPRKYLTHFR